MTPLLLLVVECALKAALLIVAAALCASLLRRQSAALRHAVWAAGLIAALSLPVATQWVPALPGEPLAAAAAVLASTFQAPQAAGAIDAFQIQAGPGAGGKFNLTLLLAAIWSIGAGMVLLRLAAGCAHLAWLSARAEPVFDMRLMRMAHEIGQRIGLKRTVRLLQSQDNSMPVTWGFLRPRILLPAGSPGWSDERLHVVLSHELAHVRRADWLVQMLAETGRAFYWFNPLVWLACDRLRQESEQAADDAVLNSGVESTGYAGHLLDLARSLRGRRKLSSVALAMARPTHLERRFSAMLNPSLNRQGLSRGSALVTATLAVALLVPVSALRAPAQSLSGKLSGTVTDSSGAVLPNATVIVSNPEARTRDMTATSEAGVFEFNGLPAAGYSIKILKPGFAPLQAEGLLLRPGLNEERAFTLNVGSINEQVNVYAGGDAGPPKQIAVGGTVQAAKLINRVVPQYPLAAKEARVQGMVLLEAVISQEGVPLSLRVLNSQIDAGLARAAVEAVNQWRYQPTLLNGVPIEVMTQVTVNFTLLP